MKNKRGIFSSLIKNHTLFVLSSVLLSLFLVFVFLFKLSIDLKDSNFKVLPSQLIQADFKRIDSKQVESLDGWIEILDENNKVIYIKGNKLDNKESYTYEEILDLNDISISNGVLQIKDLKDQKDIVGFSKPFKDSEGNSRICIVKYPANKVKSQLVLNSFPEDIEKHILPNIKVFVALLLILLILNIFLFSRRISKKIGEPLNSITEGINTMSKGNYDVKLHFEAEEEFILIRDAFNTMIDEINRSEREKANIEQQKNIMLADLSHDIKTPITTILNYSKALNDGLIEDEDQKHRYLNTIYNKTLRVNEMVDDLFQLTKLESVDYELNLNREDFVELLRRIISEHYNEAMEKDISMDIVLPEYEIFLDFDQVLISRAISNIIVNGIKHNPRGTKLRIELKDYKDKIILEIGDNGKGIPDSIRGNVFEVFVTGDESRRSTKGTGLGLAISKKIFEKHGWKLELSNPRKDEKTIFSMIIPIK